jgi:hypothetical protein
MPNRGTPRGPRQAPVARQSYGQGYNLRGVLQRAAIAAHSKARGRTQPGSAQKRQNPQQFTRPDNVLLMAARSWVRPPLLLAGAADAEPGHATRAAPSSRQHAGHSPFATRAHLDVLLGLVHFKVRRARLGARRASISTPASQAQATMVVRLPTGQKQRLNQLLSAQRLQRDGFGARHDAVHQMRCYSVRRSRARSCGSHGVESIGRHTCVAFCLSCITLQAKKSSMSFAAAPSVSRCGGGGIDDGALVVAVMVGTGMALPAPALPVHDAASSCRNTCSSRPRRAE